MFKIWLTLSLWFLCLVFAMTNGVVGLLLWQPWFGEYGNHLAKCFIGVLFFFFVLGWLHARFTKGPQAMKAAWLTAWIWLIMTVCVEFLLEIVLRGKTLAEAIESNIHAYYFWQGQLWPLVLLVLFASPIFWAWKMSD